MAIGESGAVGSNNPASSLPAAVPPVQESKPTQVEPGPVGSGASSPTKPPTADATRAYGHGYRLAKIENTTTTFKCDVGVYVGASVSVADLRANAAGGLDSSETKKSIPPAVGRPALEGAEASGEIHGDVFLTCTKTQQVVTYVPRTTRHAAPHVKSPPPHPASPSKAAAITPPASKLPAAVAQPPNAPPVVAKPPASPKEPPGNGPTQDRLYKPTDDDVRNATGYIGQLDPRDKADWASRYKKADEVTASLKGKCAELTIGKDFCNKEADMVGTVIKKGADLLLSQGYNATSLPPP